MITDRGLHSRRRMTLGASLSMLSGLLLIGCGGDIPSATTPLESQGPLRLTVPDTGTADRASLVLLTARVDSSLVRGSRQVTFTTTAGTFGGQASIAVQADSLGVARAMLTPPADTSTALVTATSSNATRSASLTFRRARAESVEFVADAFAMDTGLANAVRVVAVLRRRLGQPSPGLEVTFNARRPSGEPIGLLSTPGTFSDPQGVAIVRFSVGNTSYRGPVSISATTLGPDGASRVGSTSIIVR